MSVKSTSKFSPFPSLYVLVLKNSTGSILSWLSSSLYFVISLNKFLCCFSTISATSKLLIVCSVIFKLFILLPFFHKLDIDFYTKMKYHNKDDTFLVLSLGNSLYRPKYSAVPFFVLYYNFIVCKFSLQNLSLFKKINSFYLTLTHPVFLSNFLLFFKFNSYFCITFVMHFSSQNSRFTHIFYAHCKNLTFFTIFLTDHRHLAVSVLSHPASSSLLYLYHPEVHRSFASPLSFFSVLCQNSLTLPHDIR